MMAASGPSDRPPPPPPGAGKIRRTEDAFELFPAGTPYAEALAMHANKAPLAEDDAAALRASRERSPPRGDRSPLSKAQQKPRRPRGRPWRQGDVRANPRESPERAKQNCAYGDLHRRTAQALTSGAA